MRRLITLVSAVTAATLLVVGCSSSSDSGSPSGGGSGGSTSSGGSSSGGTSSGAKCAAAAYADVSASEFAGKTVSGKACADASDASNACNNDIATIGATCGKTCLLQGGDDAAQATCVATCIDQGLSSSSTPFTDPCMSCYTADVACARKLCFSKCVTAPTGAVCTQCRIDMGCLATFYDCSGLPVPTGVDLGTGTGSAGDGAGGTGGP